MLSLLREGWIAKSISSVLITCIVTTSTASLAAVVPQNDVNSGQAAGMEFLGGSQTMPTISNGTSTLNATSDNTQLFLGDFMPGVTGAPDTSTMEGLADDPEGLVAAGMVLRTAQKEAGCRSTTLTQRQAAKTVHRITAVWRDANGIETPTTFSGPFRVNFPTLGIAKRSEQIIQAATASTPALVLKYEHTPYQVPANSYFTYSPAIVGSVSGSFTSIGAPSNNFTFQGSFTANNASVIEIKADLFQVSRTFTIQGGACPADPVTACAHQGINLCHPATSSLSSYFARKDQQGENDYGVVGLELSRLAANAEDPDAEAIGDAAAATLDGATPEFAELFSGCSKVETTEQTTLEQHVEQIVACQSRWAPQHGCQQQRQITAAKTGRSITVRTWLNWLVRGGNAYVPTYGENLRATIQLFKMSTTQSSPYFQVLSTSTGEPLDFQLHSDTDYANGHASTPGKTFWYPMVTAGDASDLIFESYGNAANNWTPTINIRIGQQYTFEYEEYLITGDEVISAGSESCEFISRAIQDGMCPSTGLSAACALTNSEGLINSNIPMGGAASGIGEAAGSNPAMPANCMISNVDPMSCQPANLLAEYLPNIEPPSWLDNCHLKGKFINPGGVVAATDICVRKPAMDTCINAGDTTSTCYEKELFFDCGEEKSRPVVSSAHTQEVCGSPIRCLGTECTNTVGEANGDLGQAMAAGNMVEALSQDLICEETGQPPTGPYDTCTIRVFTGEFRECRIPALSGGGIAPDCCEEGTSAANGMGINPVLAAKAFDATKKLATNQQFTSMLAKVPGSSFVEGAWTATKAVVQTITDPITSFAAKVGQKVVGDATKAAATDALGATGGQTFAVKMMQMTYNFLDDIGMEAVADALFSTATDQAGNVAVNALSGPASMIIGALNVAMLVYSIAQIAGQLIYGCEEEEYELGMERQKKNCHATGQYCSKEFPEILGGGCEIHNKTFCCYMSPLNRIIAEQMRMQLGGYGSAKEPNCSGFTLDEVNAFDWASLDLSEWEQLLSEAGILPDNEQEAEDKWGMEADRGVIASNGPSFGPDGAVSPVELVEDRLSNAESQFEEARDELSGQQACSYSGGMQWYGSAPTYADDSTVQDVYRVTRNYGVNTSYFGPCSGGDPDWTTTTVNFDINSKTASATAIYGCDGGSQHWGTVDNLYLRWMTVEKNGVQIPSLPAEVDDERCKAAPGLASILPFYTTHSGSGSQQVAPSCTTTNAVWNPTTTTHYDEVSVVYTIRRHETVSNQVPTQAENCIDPTAP